MDFYLPDKPIIVELEEEKEVTLLPFRRLSSIVLFFLVATSLVATSIIFAFGIVFSEYTYIYAFLPVLVFYPFNGIFFVTILIVELAIIVLSVIYILLHSEIGLLSDFKRRSSILASFSELFLSGYAISILLVLLFNPGEGVEVPLYDMHRVILGAPILEEMSFRLIWLLIPAWITAYLRNEINTSKSREQGFISHILRGKVNIKKHDWILIFLSALFFGISHFVTIVFDYRSLTFSVGIGWGFGKIFQATFVGIVMGYLALKYGILTSIAFHWLVNSLSATIYLILTFGDVILLSLFALLNLGIIFIGFIETIVIIYRFLK